nr:CST complex subunit STN1-like [Pogona vitticeps]
MFDVQIARMLELPNLYRDIYDTSFQFPEEVQSGRSIADMLGSISILSEKIRVFLMQNKIQSFYKQDLETVKDLVSLVKDGGQSTNAEQVSKSYFACIYLLVRSSESHAVVVNLRTQNLHQLTVCWYALNFLSPVRKNRN